MPRVGRVVLPNYPHHVVQRGHNRQVVFAAEEDYQRYVKTEKGDRFICFPFARL